MSQDLSISRGGLATWQMRAVTRHIEEHLCEKTPLVTLAKLVRLCPSHFCRAFRQSFGVPPHEYHIRRRIEKAKTLLAERKASVTGVGFTLATLTPVRSASPFVRSVSPRFHVIMRPPDFARAVFLLLTAVRCPLWVISGHSRAFRKCLLYPQKRTSPVQSNLLGKRPFLASYNVRYGPNFGLNSDIARSPKSVN